MAVLNLSIKLYIYPVVANLYFVLISRWKCDISTEVCRQETTTQ